MIWRLGLGLMKGPPTLPPSEIPKLPLEVSPAPANYAICSEYYGNRAPQVCSDPRNPKPETLNP